MLLKGDPDKPGVYTIMLRVPAHTKIAAHSHRDDRVATVISGSGALATGKSSMRQNSKRFHLGVFVPNHQVRRILQKPATKLL